MAVVQEIGNETAATRGPHLVGIDRRHDGGHHVAGSAVTVQFLAVFVIVVQHIEDVTCGSRRIILKVASSRSLPLLRQPGRYSLTFTLVR